MDERATRLEAHTGGRAHLLRTARRHQLRVRRRGQRLPYQARRIRGTPRVRRGGRGLLAHLGGAPGGDSQASCAQGERGRRPRLPPCHRSDQSGVLGEVEGLRGAEPTRRWPHAPRAGPSLPQPWARGRRGRGGGKAHGRDPETPRERAVSPEGRPDGRRAFSGRVLLVIPATRQPLDFYNFTGVSTIFGASWPLLYVRI